MDNAEHYSVSATTWARIFMVLQVLQLFLLACVIVPGMKYRQLSGCTSTQEVPLKPGSADAERQRSNYGIREPGYGRALQGL